MTEQSRLYFTTEEILASHRHWITKTYCEDHKSEEEIVNLLRESGRDVTVEQLHNCLLSWSILPSSYISLSAVTAPQYHQDYETDPSLTSHNTSILAYLSSNQTRTPYQNAHQFPSTESPTLASPARSSLTFSNDTAALCTTQSPPGRDRLKVQCYHGNEHHEAETTLNCVPQGPSQLEVYETEDQPHEKLAIMLEQGDIPREHILQYRRARGATVGPTTLKVTKVRRPRGTRKDRSRMGREE